MRTVRGLLSLGSAPSALAWSPGDPLKFRKAFFATAETNALLRHPERMRAMAEAIAATHPDRWPGVVFRLIEVGSGLRVEVCDRRTLAGRVDGAMLASEIRHRAVPHGHVLALAQSEAVQVWTFNPAWLLRVLKAGELGAPPPQAAPASKPPSAPTRIRSRYPTNPQRKA